MATIIEGAAAPLPESYATNAYDLLSDIIDIILAEPKRYNQHNWLGVKGGEVGGNMDDRVYPACGTIGCVAGWTVALTEPRIIKNATLLFPFSDTAAKKLGLTDEQANELFDGDAAGRGPNTIYKGYGVRNEVTPEIHAAKGAEHIRKFQSKYEKQLRAKQL